MESAEKDCSILGNLFQTIINDLRSSTPVWEDFTYKATKLHQCLKTTLVAISSFLEAFQRVADMATNSKGATKEIGSALTRLCMRHRSIETCLKALTSSILDSLVAPLQERLEDWKKVVAQVDKDHAKEYKKARQEIKKAASDTMRLQKKVKKGIPQGKNEMQTKLDIAMQDVNARYQQLEEIEKQSVRTALIEERGRFCLFISCIKPFVDHEVHLLTEVTHLQEIMHSLCLQASEPNALPASSEQVIADLKGMDPATLNLQVRTHPSPPSSPSSLGSRKSSMCSINSINSSSSGSSKSHSPSHTMHKRTASQPPLGTERLTSVSSQDSGFTSQDTLFLRPTTPQSLNLYQASNSDRDSTGTDTADCDSTPTTPSANFVTTPIASTGSTNSLPASGTPAPKIDRARPHTISAGSERTYNRPALKPELFEPLTEKAEPGDVAEMRDSQGRITGKGRPSSTSSTGSYGKPAATINKMQPVLPPHCPRPKVKAVPPPALPPGAQPVYANTMEIQRMAMENKAKQQQEDNEGEATTPTTPSSRQSTQMQQNSLELAAAIRELEESTAALNSTYDTASHTSHTSLQCSSGYATMNSTPSGSEDTIASGGVPATGTNLSRRSSVNTPKPPPPVRRTASISSTTGPPIRQLSEGGIPTGSNGQGGPDQAEGPYAELQVIQQSIHQKKKVQPAPPPKPGQLQRQHSAEGQLQHHVSSPSPDRASISSGSSGGSGHYAVPSIAPPSQGSASVIQSLNAKFASLNQQYQDPQYQQQPVPSNGGTYIGAGPGGDPSAANLMPPPAAAPPAGQHRGQGPPQPKPGGHPQQPQGPGHHQQGHGHHQQGHGHHQQGQGHYQQSQGHHQGHHHQGHHPQGPHQQGHHHGQPHHAQQAYHHGHQGHGHPQGHAGQGHHPGQAVQGHPHPPPGHAGNLHAQIHQEGQGEDFPLPPTVEELQEMETMYARPPPVNPKPKMQGDLLSELKRRVSMEEASDV